MRPVPSPVLITLLVLLCALCAWQWHRETGLRRIVAQRLEEVTELRAERDEIETRVKAADAEILRLTASLNELRTTSVAKVQHDEVLSANAQMRGSVEKQNALILQQNEALTRANESIQRANDTIKSLTAERDSLAKRVNEVTALYNKLANPAKP